MKYFKKNISVFLLYQLGINLYFCFWFLGSEGSAMIWYHKEITFFDLLLAANLSVPLSLLGLGILRKLTRRKSDNHIGLIKLNFIFQSLFISFLFTIFFFITTAQLQKEVNGIVSYLLSTGFLSLSIYHFNLSLLIIALLNLNQRLGGIRRVFNYLLQWVTPPKEVEKAFLFIDLNNSTAIAERLKSDAFSGLIRDSFKVLSEIVLENDGIEIYQYVGDEAILCWDFNNKAQCLQGLQLFSEFKKLLKAKQAYFQNKYNAIPSFKAAIHGGLVTQSEMGLRVIHTAYHGDVLNTTSRIQSLCKHFKTDLLVSDAFYENIQLTLSAFDFEKISGVKLVGKEKEYTIYKVQDPISDNLLISTPTWKEYQTKTMTSKLNN